MANNKKFIVKNGLQTEENVVIGTAIDNGTNKLQVTGSSKFTGTVEVTQASAGTPTAKFTNSAGPTSLIAEFVGDSSSVQIANVGPGDYSILNTGQSNGIKLYNNAAGMELLYNNAVDISLNSAGIDFKREPTYQGNVFWNAGNDGAGSGLDADLIDGLDSAQFLRSDQDDIMNGSLTITGDLTVSGNTTYINTEEILLSDNIITLNANYTGSTPTENSGIEVERGTLANATFQWLEASDKWELGGPSLGLVLGDSSNLQGSITSYANSFIIEAGGATGGSNGTVYLSGKLNSTQANAGVAAFYNQGTGVSYGELLYNGSPKIRTENAGIVTNGNARIQGSATIGTGSGGAYIYMDGAGGNGTIYSSAGEIGFLNATFNYAFKIDTAGDVRVTDDIYAQKFIDINNNTYQVVPSTTSVLNNIDLEGALRHNGNTTTYINFPATDRIGFTLGGTQYGLMTNASFQYTGDIIADRFLDRADNNYFADPAGASVLNTVGIDSDLFHNGNATTKLAFGTDTIDFAAGGVSKLNLNTVSADFYNGGANNAVNIGISATERFNIDVTGSQGYIRYIQDDTNATDNSVNFEIISSGIGLNKFKFNKDIDVGTNTVNGSFGNFSSGVYASVFYDYDDESYFADFNNIGNSINMAGTIEGGNGTAAAPTYTFGSDTNTGMFRGAADRLDFSAGGNVELQVLTTYAAAPGSFRAPLFYDSNNTAYYGDFAGTSQMSRIDIDDYIRHRGDTDNYFGFSANDTFRVWTAAVQRLNIDGDSADFSVNTYAPRYYDSVSTTYYLQPGSTSVLNKVSIDDYVIHNGDTNTYIGFDAVDQFGVWTNNAKRLNITATEATFTNSVYAPNYYTNDYLIHNGDTNTYIGFDAVDQFGVWTDGTKRINVDTEVDLLVNTNVTGNLDVTGRATIGNSLTRPDDLSVLTNSAARIGGSDVHLHIASLGATGNYAVAMQSGRQSDNANFPMALQPNGGNVGVGTLTAGATLTINKKTAQGNNPFIAGTSLLSLGDVDVVDYSIRTDSVGNIYHINDNGGSQIWYDTSASGKFAILNDGNIVAGGDSFVNVYPDATTNFIATPAANIFHAAGGISIEGKDSLLSIYNADGANTAINEATFLGVNELGFSGGGGFFMDDTVTMKVRGNKDVFTTGNLYAGRYYDGNNNAYYVDPASTSIMNRIDLDDYIRHNGDTDNYFGFAANDTFRVFTGGTQRLNVDNDSADFAVNVYAPAYYDSDDNTYYLNPKGTSVLGTIELDDYIQHKGNTDAYFGWAGNNNFKLFTNGTERVNVDANSADFAVNVYAPRYYDSNDTLYYVDPASVSRMNNVSFGVPGNGTNVNGRFLSIEGNTDTSGEGSSRIFFAEHNSTVASQDMYGMSLAYQGGSATINSVTGQPVTLNGTSNGTWALIGHDNSVNGSWAMRGPRDASNVEARVEFRAPLFRDSNNTAYYGDFASTSVVNVMRANQFQLDGSTNIIDSASGDYGTIKVSGTTGGYAGYAIEDDWVFMSDGPTNMGLYNDTDNEWSLYAQRNDFTRLYANGIHQLGAENGYGSAANAFRSPIYYPPSGTTRFLDLDATNAAQSLKVGGKIFREGYDANGGSANIFLEAQDQNQFIWNTATNWGIFWATNTSASYRHTPFGDNMITFVGAGNVRAAIDLDSGDIYSQGEVFAGSYNLYTGTDSFPLNPAYGTGSADDTLFDATKYWEKRQTQALSGIENPPTTNAAEYVKNNDGPFASSYVLRTSGYRSFDSDYIEVEPGEEIYGEIYVRTISGSGGLVYMGVRRYDKDKKPIAGNDGISYFVVGGNNQTSTSWQKFSGHHTIPTSHTVYNGSDGGGCKYVRMIVLMNYNTGGAVREYGPPMLKRSNVRSRVRTNEAMYSPIYYDSNDNNFYLDPASTSKLNTVDASNFRDRDNTARYMDPATGGNVQGTWNWNNGTISNLNNLTFADPGPNEGIEWLGGNGWKIYESPDDLATNAGGNLQFVTGTTLRARINSSGDVEAGRYMYATRFIDVNNNARFLDPASTSELNDVNFNGKAIFKARQNDSAGSYASYLNEYNTNVAAEFWSGNDQPVTIYFRSGVNAPSDFAYITYDPDYDNSGENGALVLGSENDGTGSSDYIRLQARTVVDNNQVSSDNSTIMDWMHLGSSVARINSDYFQHDSDVRSPLFYDSNDTAYYGDFAGTSITNVMRANQLQLDGSTYTIDSSSGDYGSISVNGYRNGWAGYSINNQWAFMSSGAGNAGIFNDTDNEWAILASQNSDVQIYYNGTWEERSRDGYMEARGSYRSPVWYDSNNTAYRIDGNGTSRLLTLNVDNVIGGSVDGYASYLLRDDNRTISPSEDPAGRLQFGFTSWANNDSAPYADYLHLRSYTDSSGGSDNLVTFKKSGIGMRIWQQAWNSTTAYATYRNVGVYNENPGGGNDFYASVYYDSNNTTYRVDPDGTSNVKYLKSNTDGSSSYTRALTIKDAGQPEINFGSYPAAWTSALQIQNNNNTDFVWISPLQDGYNARFRTGGTGLDFYTDGGVDTGTYSAFIGSGSVRSSVFYDLDNTGYYLNLNGNSNHAGDFRTNEFYARGWFRNDNSGQGLYNQATSMHWYSDNSSRFRLYSTSSTSQILFTTSGNNARGYVYADNSNNIGFLDASGNWALRTNYGTTEVYGNLYANIMYDRNNSGYYVDPASTSVMNVVRAQRFAHVDDVSQDDQFGIYFSNNESTAYAIFREGGGWNYRYPDLRIAFHTGIKMGANASYNGMRFYNDYNMAGQVMSINNAEDPLGGDNVYVNNNLQAGSSLRAPIFYDSNDTNYRMDMNATNSSRFRGVQAETMAYMGLSGQTRSSKEYYAARPRITGDSNYWTGSVGWGTVDMNTVADWGSGFFDSWSNPANQPSGTSHWVGTQAYHYTNGSSRYGWQIAGGPIGNLRFRQTWGGFGAWRTIPMLNVNDGNNGALYANIFYDSDNTGYYCDPTGFTNLNTGVRATDFYARSWLRNDNAGTGMYNQSTGSHSYSRYGQYWAITGNNNSSSMSLQLKAAYEGTMCRWMYGDRFWSGELNAAGQWQFQTAHADGYSPTLRFIESGNESWTGNIGNDAGKLEYHANRFYLEAGGNSDRIVQFRRNGSDVSYVANDGVYVGTATSARWADLAERYRADDIYEPGTVMGIDLDGDAEITIWREGLPMVGVISTNPAVQMNDMGIDPKSKSAKAKRNPFIALKGRIPCIVSGEDGAVKKGMWLIPDPEAVGKAKGVPYGTPGVGSHEIIGIALSDSENGEVEVKV